MSDPEPSRSEQRRRQRWASRRSPRVRIGLIGLAVVAVAVLVISVVVIVLRPDEEQGSGGEYVGSAEVVAPQVGAELVRDASTAVATVSSYDYRQLRTALLRGLAVTTGAYRTAFRNSLAGGLGSTARSQKLVQTFTVQRAGLGETTADGTTARVLVFGAERVTSGGGAATTTPRTITVTVVRDNGTARISQLEIGANAGIPLGTPALTAAANAGRAQIAHMLSYRRDSFDDDYDRALDGAVDPLRSRLEDGRDDTRSALDDGDFDLAGRVTAVAVDRALGNRVVLLVAATNARAGDDADESDSRLAVTVVATGDGWRTSAITDVPDS